MPWVFRLEGQRWREWPQGSMPVSRALRELESSKWNHLLLSEGLCLAEF